MRDRTVIYTGNFRLCPADAAGRRVLALASALHLGGYSVRLYPALGKISKTFRVFNPEVDYDQKDADGEECSLGVVLRALRNEGGIQAVILYNPSNAAAMILRFYTACLGIRAVLDLTEWYEYSHLPSLRAVAEVFFRMNLSYRLYSRMILISEYLYNHYRPPIGRVIPPLAGSDMVLRKERAKLEGDEPLRIFYAGFPGKKDRIDLLIGWLTEVSLPFPVQLILAGPKINQISDFAVERDGLEIVALGPIDREAVFNLYAECHISAIIRDDARYERAGFPTKSVEGWSFGVPALVMSHASFALRAFEYGAAIAIESENPVSSLESILKGLYMDKERLSAMSESALRLVADHHSVESYVDVVKEVLL